MALQLPALAAPTRALTEAERVFTELSEFDVTKESIESTVDRICLFLGDSLQTLQEDLLDLTPLKTDAIVVGVEEPRPDSPKRASTPKRRGTSRGSTRRPISSPIKEDSKRGSGKAAPPSTKSKADNDIFSVTQVPTKLEFAPASLSSVPTTAYVDTTRIETENGETLIMATPLEVFTKLLETHFSKVQASIRSKLVEFLDDRVSGDRASLHYAKAKAQKQLFVAREMGDVFRRSYDLAHRQREAEAVRLVELELRQKYTYDMLALKKVNKQLETANKLLAKSVETLEATVKENESLVDEYRNSKKSSKKSKHNKSSHGHGHGHGHGHCHGHGHGSPSSSHGHSPTHESKHESQDEVQSVDGSIESAQSHDQHSPDHSHGHSHHAHGHAHERADHHSHPFHAGSKNVLAENPQRLPHICYHCEKHKEQNRLISAELSAANSALADNIVMIGLLERKVVELQAQQRPPSPVTPQVSISMSSAAAGMTNFGPSPSPQGTSPLTIDEQPTQIAASLPGLIAIESPSTPVVGQMTSEVSAATAVSESADVNSGTEAEATIGAGLVESSASSAAAPLATEEMATAEAAGPAEDDTRDVSFVIHSNAAPVAEAFEEEIPVPVKDLDDAEAVVVADDVTTFTVEELSSAPVGAAATTTSDELLSVRQAPDYLHYSSTDEDANRMPQIDSAGSIVLPEHPQFGSAFDLASPSMVSKGEGRSLHGQPAGIMSLDLGSIAGASSSDSAEAGHGHHLDHLTNMSSGVGFLPSKYVEGIQSFFQENEKFFGKRIDVSTLKLTDVFALLQERVKAHKEVQTQLLSLEFQNTQLSDRIRTDEATLERQEKLHSLQLLERGVLLRELASQVNELRANLHRIEAEAKLKRQNSLSKRVKGIKPSPQTDEGAPSPIKANKTEMLLPNIKVDLGEVKRFDSLPDPTPAQAARDRLLQSSLSMPILSDEYGPVGGPGASYVARLKSRGGGGGSASPGSSRAASPVRAQTAGQSRTNSALGTSMEREEGKEPPPVKVLSAFLRAALPAPERGLSPEAQAQARVANTNFVADLNVPMPALSQEKLAELKAIRAQVVGLVAERYPKKKAPVQLATTAAKSDALNKRILPPNPSLVAARAEQQQLQEVGTGGKRE